MLTLRATNPSATGPGNAAQTNRAVGAYQRYGQAAAAPVAVAGAPTNNTAPLPGSGPPVVDTVTANAVGAPPSTPVTTTNNASPDIAPTKAPNS